VTVLPDAVYVLPLRSTAPADEDLVSYVRALAGSVDVVVVDGSPPDVFAAHRAAWGDVVQHLPAPAAPPGANGKVLAVRAGLAASTASRVVVADDDVRYSLATLARALRLLEHADLVRPQNVFSAWPWHARWDTGRTLLNRAAGADYPGTLVLRRSALGSDGYAADVLFENLELMRTVEARGGRVLSAPGLVVERRPPTLRAFLGQRVRQAYDSQSQPGRLLLELAAGPAFVLLLLRRRLAWLAAVAAAVAAVAEAGRRRGGARTSFPATSALWAPGWAVERSVCAWWALVSRMRGGARYRGTRIRTAAHARSWIARECGVAR